MIDRLEWDRLRSKAAAVQSGKYLVSDRVADHLYELVEVIEAVPGFPEQWSGVAQRNPDVARVVQESVDELVFMLDQVGTDESPGVIDAGMPVDVTSEVNG